MPKRIFLFVSLALLVFILAACGTPPSAAPTATSPTPSTTVATQPPAANLPNPASENCVKQGGTISIQKNSDGSEYGLCVFPDGKQCEEWAMQRGECPVGGIQVAGRYTAQLPAADCRMARRR
jgi:putative hemolysin